MKSKGILICFAAFSVILAICVGILLLLIMGGGENNTGSETVVSEEIHTDEISQETKAAGNTEGIYTKEYAEELQTKLKELEEEIASKQALKEDFSGNAQNVADIEIRKLSEENEELFNKAKLILAQNGEYLGVTVYYNPPSENSDVPSSLEEAVIEDLTGAVVDHVLDFLGVGFIGTAIDIYSYISDLADVSEGMSSELPDYLMNNLSEKIAESGSNVAAFIENESPSSDELLKCIENFHEMGKNYDEIAELSDYTIDVFTDWNIYYYQINDIYKQIKANEEIIDFYNS